MRAFLIACRPSFDLSVNFSHFHLLFIVSSSSSSPEPLGHFQPNLAQSILGWRGIKFVQMKGPALFQGEIITKEWKCIEEFERSSPEPLGQFQPNLAQSICGWRWFKFVQMKGFVNFQGEKITDNEIAKIHWQNFKNLLLKSYWGNFIQTVRKESLCDGHMKNNALFQGEKVTK